MWAEINQKLLPCREGTEAVLCGKRQKKLNLRLRYMSRNDICNLESSMTRHCLVWVIFS